MSRSARKVTQRSRRLIRGIATGGLSRVLAVCSPLVVIPLALDLMGPQNYGVWVTVTAVTSMFLWADLGLGNGLMTKTSAALARGDRVGARRVIASAYALLAAIALAAMAALLGLALFVPWNDVLNTESPAAPAIAVITLGAFILNIPLGLIQRVQYSLGEVALSNVMASVGPLLTIVAALLAAEARASATQAVLLMASGPLVASVLATVVTMFRHPDLVPGRHDLAGSTTRALLSLGAMYLLVQVMSAVAMNADNVIIAQVRGAADVVDYSIVGRLFMIAGLVISLTSLPLWPANAEALAQGDRDWVRRTTARMTLLSGGCMCAISALLVALAQPFVRAWIGPEVDVPLVMLLGFAVFWSLVALLSPAFMVANSQAKLRPQLVGWSVFAASSIVSKTLIAAWDIQYIPLAAAGLYGLCLGPSAILGYRQVMHAQPTKEQARGLIETSS